MKMKKILALAILCLTLVPTIALAHPPTDIKANWNASTQSISVTAKHTVEDPAKHYVLAVQVLDDKGNQLAVKRYTSQSSAKDFTDTISVPNAKAGTNLRIRLTCNILGETTASVK